jgi:hypothetical protein
MNRRYGAAITLILAFAIGFSVEAAAQSLEQRIVADVKALNYNVEKGQSGIGYNVTEKTGMYDDSDFGFHLGVIKLGKNEFVTVILPVATLDTSDHQNIGEMAMELIPRNSLVLCANYSAYFIEEYCVYSLLRVIESGCYSKSLLSDVISCMKSEYKSRTSDAVGYSTNQAQVAVLNQIVKDMVKDISTKTTRGGKK